MGEPYVTEDVLKDQFVDTLWVGDHHTLITDPDVWKPCKHVRKSTNKQGRHIRINGQIETEVFDHFVNLLQGGKLPQADPQVYMDLWLCAHILGHDELKTRLQDKLNIM